MFLENVKKNLGREVNISSSPVHKNISDKTLDTAGKMYFYYFNIPPKRSSIWYTFYTRLFPLHSLRKILLALSSMDVKDLALACSDFCRHDVRRKKAMIEAVAEVLNLTIRDTGFEKLLANKTEGSNPRNAKTFNKYLAFQIS